ncbi:MAG: hypothetical protein WEB03_07485 [Nitriliruptor sp.]|uniref:hypothetical protein n=1 Tax=Nitriliruptor sp. TaxID=2448056 RepID=UPI0034A096A6
MHDLTARDLAPHEPAADDRTDRLALRRRARLFVALYGVCLVMLLVAGAWVAPADAASDGRDAPNGGWLGTTDSPVPTNVR